MDLRRIQQLCPHFMNDKNEDWMEYLPSGKKTFIETKRVEILALLERIESHRVTYRQHATTLRDATQQRKDELEREFEAKQKDFANTRDEKIRILLPVLRRLREQGIRLKEQIAEDEANSMRKRSRLQDMIDHTLVDQVSGHVEMVIDDYMPNYLVSNPTTSGGSTTSSLQNNQNKTRRQKSTARNPAEELPDLQLKTSPVKKKDTFLDGVEDPFDRAVLKDLRSDIIKYGCRDRVIKAIQSITMRDQRLATMDQVSRISQVMKCSTE